MIYDFDGTLSPKNMQEFGFIQAIGSDPDAFWARVGEMSLQNDASGILCYMYQMLQSAKHKGLSLRRDSFRHFGSQVELYPGVKEWFSMINAFGAALGVDVKHYIISSGLKEMVEGTAIAHEFENIYACSYLYDVDGVAYWPAVAVDYTQKTQFLYKINKGIREVSDKTRINEYVPVCERPIPIDQMIYFGDGETDVPCMRLVKENGGHSIVVYRDEELRSLAERLIQEGRVNNACLADYRDSAALVEVVRQIITDIASR